MALKVLLLQQLVLPCMQQARLPSVILAKQFTLRSVLPVSEDTALRSPTTRTRAGNELGTPGLSAASRAWAPRRAAARQRPAAAIGCESSAETACVITSRAIRESH